MANPQSENGHIRIANTLWEAWGRIRVSGEAEQVLKSIIRQTWGYGKKMDIIKLDKFVLLTGLKKPTVLKAIHKLIEMNMITKKDNGRYGFVKDFELWKPLPKKITITQKDNLITQKDNDLLPKKIISTDEPITIKTKQSLKDLKHTHVAKEETPLQKVVNHYKTKTGYKKEDKTWDKAHFPRCSSSAKKLIDFCGSPELAIACIDGVAAEMVRKKLDWTIETIVKHSAKWKLEYKEKHEQELKKQEETEKAVKFAQTMGV